MPSRHSSVLPASDAAEVVEARAGMGVDDAERSRLVVQMREHASKHGVLHDVGKVAGVIGVAVVHRRVAINDMAGSVYQTRRG